MAKKYFVVALVEEVQSTSTGVVVSRASKFYEVLATTSSAQANKAKAWFNQTCEAMKVNASVSIFEE